MLDIATTDLADVLVLTPRRFEDARGNFAEVWNPRRMADAGLDVTFVQDNQSVSTQAGTVRGLHYQAPPSAQGKLVRCVAGALWDVAVDARVGSPRYGRWFGTELSAENGRQLWIPPGFLHGFVTRKPNTICLYKCTAPYDAGCDGAVIWNDADLGIDWGVSAAQAVTSDRDAAAPAFSDWKSPFTWDGATSGIEA